MTAASSAVVDIRPLDARDDVNGFSCGEGDLDEWLREDAVRLSTAGSVAVYIGRSDDRIVGYLSLLADCIRVNSKERTKTLGMQHDDHPVIPAVKIAHLAVQSDMHGKHIGTALLRFASDRALVIAETIGCRLLTLDAYVHKVSWYEGRGFVRNVLVAKEAASEFRCPEECPEHRKQEGRRVSMRLDLGGDHLPAWMTD